jgi:hypothetical protein
MRSHFYRPQLGALLLAVTAFVHVSAKQPYPQDVTDFLQSRNHCEDLRGNMVDTVPGNTSDIQNAIKDTTDQCKGTDKALDALKQKYAGDPAVMQALNGYDNRIERDPL